MNFKLRTILIIASTIIVSIFERASAQRADEKLWQPYRITPRAGSQHIDLSGTWELSYMDRPITDISELGQRRDPFQTEIPNSVHWSLHKAGKLPHPYAHQNSRLYRWVEEKAWYYKKTFKLPAEAKDYFIFLCFDGLDYFSKIWLNGEPIGVHEGMFGGPVFDATERVKFEQENELIVEIRAANWGNRATDFETLPRTVTGERDYSKRTGYNPRASGKIVKPWVISGGSGTEAFFSLGMWQGVRAEIVPRFHLERPYLTTQAVQNGTAKLHLSAEVFTEGHSLKHQLHPWTNKQIHHPDEKGIAYEPVTQPLSVAVDFIFKGSKVLSKTFPLTLHRGRNWFEQDLELNDPKLWNPGGLGNPDMYLVKLTLSQNNKVIDELSFDYGIRTIERVATAGPRKFDRWENWQFIINGKRIFVKGMNWTPADILLDLNKDRYEWALSAARAQGVQLIRVWGGGLLETDIFYDVCNRLGIMVWQDFPIGNQDTPDYPQDVWEAQVVSNIIRLRNQPSLVMWCGGNEFNPYSYGNAASIGILERNLDIFDPSRFFVRTTPDDGSIHIYPDMDPTWYNKSYALEAWVSETGMHSIPEPALFYELVDKSELVKLGKMWDPHFPETHPDFIHHFTEYGAGRVPRMLSRASHIDDMSDPTLESISEASQVGAGEWYQIVSEKMQGNYPTTAGLMPWVFKRHWPVIAIQMMDWFGQATAPYYFLKRTYEPTHVAIDLPRLLFRPGEKISLKATITSASLRSVKNATLQVTAYDDHFKVVWSNERKLEVKEGTSVTKSEIGEYTIPADYRDRFLFLTASLRSNDGKYISTSYYYPRVLSMMEDETFYRKYLKEPIAWVTLKNGPWLKPTVARSPTDLDVKVTKAARLSDRRSSVNISVRNLGKTPSFMTKVDIEGTRRAFYASDNYFWLLPGEEKEITIEVQWLEPDKSQNASVVLSSWNGPRKSAALH